MVQYLFITITPEKTCRTCSPHPLWSVHVRPQDRGTWYILLYLEVTDNEWTQWSSSLRHPACERHGFESHLVPIFSVNQVSKEKIYIVSPDSQSIKPQRLPGQHTSVAIQHNDKNQHQPVSLLESRPHKST